MSTLYAGPGKVYINAVGMQAEGQNGAVKIAVNEATAEYAAAMFGRIGEQALDQTAEITIKPFDNWGLMATLFPSYLGITVGATAGVLQVGKRPHASAIGAGTGAKVWTPDGRLYNPLLAAVTGHPSLHLGNGRALYGDVKISCIGDPAKVPGDSGYLFAGNAVTESAAADPGGAMTMADFERGAWIGQWDDSAPVSGFTTIEAEEEWTIEVNASYSVLTVGKRVRAMKFDSIAIMAKTRPYGPSHTQILAAVGAHTQGARLGQKDLLLTGPNGKTIRLKQAEARGAGFDFGGTTLGTGEVGFVNEMTFTAGAAQPLMVISA